MLTLAERMQRFQQIDIYPVISSEFTAGRDVITVLHAIAAGGAKIVQLREKNLSKSAIYELALQYRDITAAHEMLLIINDHLDIAMAVEADGVHLGQDDLPIAAARNIAHQLILGCSTHNPTEAQQAVNAGADYINIGPIYATQTKQLSYPALGLEMLQKMAKTVTVPFTVMGGIKEHHIDTLLQLGARHIAMVTEITQSDDITATVKRLRSHWQHVTGGVQ